MSQLPGAPASHTPTSPRGGHSHFAAGARLTGDLTVHGTIELLGRIDGTITADSVMIDEGGSAFGELHADSVEIKGHFDGKISGRDVRLTSSAKVSGEIFYKTLSIESGAQVVSSCSRNTQDDPKTA